MRYAFSNVFEDPFWSTTVPMALVGWIVALVGSIITSISQANQFPVFSWWGVAFEMVAISSTSHAAFSNEIRMYRLAISSCLAIATVYTSNSTNNFVWRDNSSSGAAAAGNISSSIINLVWISYFGTTQDEPVHSYIDSFAAYKKMSPPTEFQKRMREKRRHRLTGVPGAPYRASVANARASIASPQSANGGGAPGAGGAGGGVAPSGTASQPYRMSDVSQSINIGDPTGFNRQTDKANPGGTGAGGAGDVDRVTSQASSNPSSSTYSYSVDQSNRHGLASHEVELDSAGAPGAGGATPDLSQDSNRNASTSTRRTARTARTARTLADAAEGSRFSAIVDPLGENVFGDDDLALESMQPVAKARARFSYAARESDGEIPFKEGEVLDVCDMTGNWWYCRRENGQIGICPRNYLDSLEEMSP